MDLVNLMYRYINKFINSNKLLKELANLDTSKYSLDEQKDIKKLIEDIKSTIKNYPNEVDEFEEKRKKHIEKNISMLKEARKKNLQNKKALNFIKKQYNDLLKEKKIVRDGGALYEKMISLLTTNALVNNYASSMNDSELLTFITQYIYVPFPPEIDQDSFNDLVTVGIIEDKREALWRLAFNYNQKHKDLSLIENYFIEKRDSYYITELISAVKDDINMDIC